MLLSALLEKESITLKNDFQDLEVNSLGTLSSSDEKVLSFLEEDKYLASLHNTKASAVFIREKHLEHVPGGTIPLVVEKPYLALALLSKYFVKDLIQKPDNKKVAESANVMDNVYIGNGSKVGENSQIMFGSYIGNNVTIGENTIIYPNVTIYDNTVIGDNCIIHAGTVLGSDGFGYIQESGRHVKIYHTGNLTIEDDVEIGANCSFDRAVFGTTTIKKGTKIDNLVHIAHNVVIGEHCAIAGQTGFAGSAKVGNYCMLGAQSGVSGHLEIGDGAIIAARGGVTKTIEGKKVYAGFPLFEHKQWLKIQAKIARLIK